MPSKEFKWFVKADLEQYKGEYVAIVDKKVVAHGENAGKVWKDAKRKYPEKIPALAKVPRNDTLIL